MTGNTVPVTFQSYFIQDYRWKPAGKRGLQPPCRSFQSYFIQDYRWKSATRPKHPRTCICRCFNPTSFRITVGRFICRADSYNEMTFQSYFIQDYRWKLRRAKGTRSSVRVSILLHSGLPLEECFLLPSVCYFLGFQSYFIQDYRWKS